MVWESRVIRSLLLSSCILGEDSETPPVVQLTITNEPLSYMYLLSSNVTTTLDPCTQWISITNRIAFKNLPDRQLEENTGTRIWPFDDLVGRDSKYGAV
jgi:hypothetical protein